ncbi:alpha/beta hydrolase-fold protein [Oceanobacillus sp. ISL-73]|uniref:alpha/beta hydrolase n=1 Tax=Oceanobacillus sp. ISL-73 TaxID=2819161 RepID=UPI001BE60555|nr:alpha/beta hydrolase-fold protein [Oceanobacillus sp. ISL-73]MBT2653135.1 hypothetical protein [Oceanobacillus sp. ISL-73]
MILRSSTLNKLVDKIKNQNTSEFWDEIESLGTPLIEETDIAEKQLVTFLYKEVEPIKNVVVISGPAGMDYQRNKMEKIPNTDIWPKYCEQERKLSLVTILDGDLHPHILPALHIIDQLINNKNIKPVAVLLVHNAGQREKDMGCNNKFATFLSEELTSYLEKEKGLIFGNENCICGFSFGGIASLYTSYQYPTVYKNTIMVSTSLYWSPNDFKESEYLVWYMSTREKREISIYLECGKMENHSEFQRCFGGASNLLTNRHLRNVLTAKEYSYSYYEFNGGHDFIQWIDSLRRGLMNLYG